MMIGAMIPVCVYEMSKQKCFTNMIEKASKFVNDMTQKCGCNQKEEAPKSKEAQ
jgi:hypothetical protein